MEEATRPSAPSPPPSTISCFDGQESLFLEPGPAVRVADALEGRYRAILGRRRLDWTEHHRLLRRLGAGGQGVVFLAERLGADDFRLPVALKVFSPEPYDDDDAYDQAMARMARVAARVAQIQQDNLLDVQNVVAADGVRVMEMEWIDGYDLQRLLTPAMFDRARDRFDDGRWAHLNDVIITAGASQPRLKAGIAIAVLRDCLAALSALHRQGVVHCDIKPSNIMLKRTGNAKLIDIGAAFGLDDPPESRACTPSYAAPEVLEGAQASVRSDLASLGFVLVEMLSGAPPNPGKLPLGELLAAKRSLVQRLPASLPEEVVRNELLMSLIAGLIAPDPADRFPSAEAADLVEQGAANFQRQLVRGNLASEYDNDIRVWLAGLE
ncbi:MAG TPA: serine/threonine-protein kinase [Isosphaeraceae bacterium]|jgi:serine/threonine-protein kinase|nr:serine/threonine-protein kinase [Isosphaeraceae bacterium]